MKMRVLHSSIWKPARLRAFFLWWISTSLTECFAAGDNNSAQTNSAGFTVCENSPIVIEKISVLCDSPGQYYYGNTYYRNSETCSAKDKAHVQINFEISEDFPKDSQAYITLNLQAFGSVPSVLLYDKKNLCDVADLWSIDGSTCPEPGSYSISSLFYWGEQSDNYVYSFRPKLELGFSRKQKSDKYDLGGANTENCSRRYRKSAYQHLSNAVQTFWITFGILLTVGFSYLFASYYMAQQREYTWDAAEFAKDAAFGSQPSEDNNYMDEEYMKQIAMVNKERDLVVA